MTDGQKTAQLEPTGKIKDKIGAKQLAGWLVILLGIAGSAYYLVRLPPASIVKIDNTTIQVEIADTPEKMELGLGGRDALPDGFGMWFVFTADQKAGFWMKGMRFPIDMIWFDSDGRIVTIKENASPDSYPEIFYPSEAARYVLEVPANFAKKAGMKIGDLAETHP